MKKVSLRVAAVAAALAAAAPAAATNGMRMIGFGPVQNSMGGASIAAPLDASTIVTNPAGMNALDRRVDLSGTVFTPTVKYQANGAAVFASQSSDRPPDFIPTLGAIYKTTDKLTVGVAALGIAGVGADYESGGLYGSRTLTSYLNMRLAPAVAYRLSDTLSVGVAANLAYAQMKYEVGAAMGLQPRDAQGAFGYGATFGLTWKSPENATIGLAYETRTSFQDFEWTIPAHSVMGQAVPGGTEKLSFDQPDILSVGVAFNAIEPLLVDVDLQWIRWSRTNGKGQPTFDTNPQLTGAQPFDLSWSDQYVLKIGAQYEVSKVLKVRAGYNWGASPLDQTRAFENIAFPAIAAHHFTAGAGYQFGDLTVNAAVQYSPYAKLSGGNPLQGIDTYKTQVMQLAFDLGATYRF